MCRLTTFKCCLLNVQHSYIPVPHNKVFEWYLQNLLGSDVLHLVFYGMFLVIMLQVFLGWVDGWYLNLCPLVPLLCPSNVYPLVYSLWLLCICSITSYLNFTVIYTWIYSKHVRCTNVNIVVLYGHYWNTFLCVSGSGWWEQMCSVVAVTLTNTSVQSRVLFAITLWESAVPWIIAVVPVLCRIKNCTHRDQRGRALGGRWVVFIVTTFQLFFFFSSFFFLFVPFLPILLFLSRRPRNQTLARCLHTALSVMCSSRPPSWILT